MLILYDILVIGISEYTALLIRFEFHPGMIRKPFLESMIHYTPIGYCSDPACREARTFMDRERGKGNT